MFDIWFEDINLTHLIIAASVFVVFPVQLIICKKAKSIKVKLIPSAIFAVLGIFCVVMIQIAKGWDGIGYLILAVYCALLFAACVGGILIHWIYIKLKKL